MHRCLVLFYLNNVTSVQFRKATKLKVVVTKFSNWKQNQTKGIPRYHYYIISTGECLWRLHTNRGYLLTSPRALQRESTSSTKMMVGILSRAILNMVFTSLRSVFDQLINSSLCYKQSNFARVGETKTQPSHLQATLWLLQILYTHRSLSPCHLETRLDDDTDMNVASASEATAVARYDFPVPGGCGCKNK